jgi:hypothetical protein
MEKNVSIFIICAVTHFLLLAFVLFLRFYDIEHGDIYTVLLGTFLYLPYIFILSTTNLILLSCGLLFFKNKNKWFSSVLTGIILFIWFFLSKGHIQVRYWEVEIAELLVLNLILVFMNLGTTYWILRKKDKFHYD